MEQAVLTTIHVLVAIVLSFDVLLHKRRPASAVLWLGVVWSLPVWGALAYLVFGVDQIRRFGPEREPVEHLFRRYVHPDPVPEGVGPTGPAAHILRLTEPAVRPYRVTAGNRARLLVDGDEFYPDLRAAIESARESVDFQTFILTWDASGRALLDLLERRAREGVRVRFLYDWFGSARAHFTGVFRRARRAGVDARPTGPRGYVNLRNHRTLVVVDRRIAWVGGMNIDDRNVTAPDGEPPDRDYHVRFEGPVVRDLEFQFLLDWSLATREPLEALLRAAGGGDLEVGGDALAQVIPGGPERAGSGLATAIFGAIASSDRRLWIATPYFLPDESVQSALRFAAMRGVDVRIVLPARSNHWYTAYAARALYTPLLASGVRIFERRPPFMHAKALVVDDVYAMLGSANLDYRSLQLNFELNVEVVSETFVARLTRQIEEEIERSEEVLLAAHQRRSVPRRLVENACHLFQPML